MHFEGVKTVLTSEIRGYYLAVDFLQRVHGQWRDLNPEMNGDSFLSVGRIVRIASFVTALTDSVVEKQGLTRGEWELLAAVRRSGKNCRATELSVLTKSSGAAITKRLDKLSAQGLITREVLPRDRRVVLVNLTEDGKKVIDALVPEVLEAESQLLNSFSQEEVATLQSLSLKLLNVVEPPRG